MSAPYGLNIDTDQFVDTFNADFYDPSPWDYIPQADFTPMDAMPTPAPAMGAPVMLVLVISTSFYESITYYDDLPYLLPTCFSFIAAL